MKRQKPLILSLQASEKHDIHSWDDFAEVHGDLLEGRDTVVALGSVPEIEATADPAKSQLWRWLGDPNAVGRALVMMLSAHLSGAALRDLDPQGDPAEGPSDDEAEPIPYYEFDQSSVQLVAALSGNRVSLESVRMSGESPSSLGNRHLKPLGRLWDRALRARLSGCVFRDNAGRRNDGDPFDLMEIPRQRDGRCGYVLVGCCGPGRFAVILIDPQHVAHTWRPVNYRLLPSGRIAPPNGSARAGEVRSLASAIAKRLPGMNGCTCGVPSCRRPLPGPWEARQLSSHPPRFRCEFVIPFAEGVQRIRIDGQQGALLSILVNQLEDDVPESKSSPEIRRLAGGTEWRGKSLRQLVSRLRTRLRNNQRVCAHWLDKCLYRTDSGATLRPSAFSA